MAQLYNYRGQRGFTIVELLIVIVVIGILAALVLNSFAGVQAKARDAERQTDTKALTTQLEAYYNGDGQGRYPSTLTLTETWATANLKGIDVGALRAPGLTTGITGATALSTDDAGASLAPAPTKDRYVYEARNGAALCNAASPSITCTSYRLWYVKENGGTVLVKSLN